MNAENTATREWNAAPAATHTGAREKTARLCASVPLSFRARECAARLTSHARMKHMRQFQESQTFVTIKD
jgi:hypothetical protein